LTQAVAPLSTRPDGAVTLPGQSTRISNLWIAYRA
jgi:hypothetical protein